MSIIFNHTNGWIISHAESLRTFYKSVKSDDIYQDFNFDHFFNINTPFTRSNENSFKNPKRKRKNEQLSEEVIGVKLTFESIMKSASEKGIFYVFPGKLSEPITNDASRHFANKYFESIQHFSASSGRNENDYPISVKVKDNFYIFPANCVFFNNDISAIRGCLESTKYDFILLDPPWYNRFVKRRKRFHPEHGYIFIDNAELSRIPIQELLKETGLVAVWTTNSSSHIETVKNTLFPLWGVSWISTWFWIKVTKHGNLIVPFSNEDVKQPYERLLFGCKTGRNLRNPENSRCLISVPSSIHSHKPPLTDVLKEYVPEGGSCLEIFARYLLPNWTSFGNQVLTLQQQSLFNSQLSEIN